MNKLQFCKPNGFQHKNFVYAWFQDGVCLYVGMTTTGWGRFYTHTIIGERIPVKETDELRFWFLDNAACLAYLEAGFISLFKPKFNTVQPRNGLGIVEHQCNLVIKPSYFKQQGGNKYKLGKRLLHEMELC